MDKVIVFLGTLLHDHKLINHTTVKPVHLMVTDQREIYEEIRLQYAKGVNFDQTTIMAALPHHSYTISKLNINDHSDINELGRQIIKDYQRRELEVALILATEQTKNGADPVDVSSKLQATIVGTLSERDDIKIKSLDEISKNYGPEFEKLCKSGGALPGIPTGLEVLNQMIGGFQVGTYYIGARPSQGKTAMMATMARAASESGKRVGIISVESGEHDFARRFWTLDSGVPLKKIKSGTGLKPGDYSRLINATTGYKDDNIFFYCNTKTDTEALSSVAARMIDMMGVDIIFIDYLQRIYSRGITKVEQVSNASRVITDIAKGMNIPVVCLAQTGRQAEKEAPELSHFQHSSAIEQDADVAMIINPPDPAAMPKDMFTGLHVLKNRDGEVGIVATYFNKETTSFSDWNGD